MALLCAGVNSDILRMVGRWKSDEMFRYLHVQAHPIMNGIAAAMITGGDLRLTPSSTDSPPRHLAPTLYPLAPWADEAMPLPSSFLPQKPGCTALLVGCLTTIQVLKS